MPENNLLLQKDTQEKSINEQKIIEKRLKKLNEIANTNELGNYNIPKRPFINNENLDTKKLVEKQQDITQLDYPSGKLKDFHTEAIDISKLETSQKLDLLIDKVSKIERFLERTFDNHILFDGEFKKIKI